MIYYLYGILYKLSCRLFVCYIIYILLFGCTIYEALCQWAFIPISLSPISLPLSCPRFFLPISLFLALSLPLFKLLLREIAQRFKNRHLNNGSQGCTEFIGCLQRSFCNIHSSTSKEYTKQYDNVRLIRFHGAPSPSISGHNDNHVIEI